MSSQEWGECSVNALNSSLAFLISDYELTQQSGRVVSSYHQCQMSPLVLPGGQEEPVFNQQC